MSRHSHRKEFNQLPLLKEHLLQNPFDQFSQWFAEALKNQNEDPGAFVLSSCSAQHGPTSRVVLLREFSPEYFIFFTNYNSKKGKDIESNPKVSMLFFWPWIEQQIRIEGSAFKTDQAVSDAYFHSRPRASRISAIISNQSEHLPEETDLQEIYDYAMNTLCDSDIRRPEHWGGYKIIPERYEFWQGRPGRLHDRFEYSRSENGQWVIKQLYP